MRASSSVPITIKLNVILYRITFALVATGTKHNYMFSLSYLEMLVIISKKFTFFMELSTSYA